MKNSAEKDAVQPATAINSIDTKSTSVDVRKALVEVLDLDLIGPANDHAFARELLPETPLRWYLTGFLVPTDARLEQTFDESSIEEIDSAETGGADDDTEADNPAGGASRGPALCSVFSLRIVSISFAVFRHAADCL